MTKVTVPFFVCAALIAALSHSPIYAFPTTYHYYTSTEAASLQLDSNSHWDSEASSDYITYQRPLEWDAKWLRGDKVLDLSFGSISSKQFLAYQRLKIYQPLTEKLEFRFHLLTEGDFEQDRTVMPLELKYNFTSKFALSLFGQPSLYKSEDDVGLSLFYTPDENWEYRLSGVWGDYDRNPRNLQADEWSEAPFGLTASVRLLPKARALDFAQAEVHWESPSQRTNNSVVVQDLAYESAFLSGLVTLPNGSRFGGRWLYDRAFGADGTQNRTRKRALNQFEYSFIMGPHVIRPGLNLFYRESRENGDQYVYREVLPSVWFELPPRGRSWGTRNLSFGYDATVFEQRHQQASDHNLEHRLNIKYGMTFTKAGELALVFTFDLDRFGGGETWEGGAGQFRLEF